MPSYACPTCGTINPERTCPEHKPTKTRSPSSRRTGTRQWRTTRARVLNRDNHTCQLCGQPADQVDHINQVAADGPDTLTNLRAICGPCNQARNRKDQQPTGHAVLIYGPPSSGKTRLAHELQHRLGWHYLNIDQARATTRNPTAAWQQVATDLDRHAGPIIVEGCNPPASIHRRLDQRGQTTIRTTADPETIKARLTERGWKPDHAERVLLEDYEPADFTIDTSTDEQSDLELIAAYLEATTA